MFVDQLIPRLRAAGLTVYDVRSQLPRNGGPWATRAVSAIKGIAYHWDAEHRPHEYGTLARIVAQARYHINKDWGGGARGDGLQYAGQIDNIGDIYITRDFEHVLWSVGNLNFSYVSFCWHGTTGQQPTREQIEAMQKLSEVLTTQCPEFPAGRGDLRGHQEVPGNSTACNGSFLPPTQWFRNEAQTHPERFSYDWPPAPTPAPTPTPTPPAPVPEPPKPQWTDLVAGKKSMIVNQQTTLFNSENGSAVSGTGYPAGKQIDNLVQEITVGAQVYWRTEYSKSKGINNGFKREHLSEIPQPDPTPEPTPEPTPTPEPQPEPTPEPTPQPTPEPEYPNWFVAFWNKLIDAIKAILGAKKDK